MISNSSIKLTLGLLACAGAFLAAPASRAALVDYNITVSTASLIGNASGPFALDFQLNDGSGAVNGDGNNTATITINSFGGGGALGSPTAFGNASGSLSTGITLTDGTSTPFNELFQSFTPGGSLNFDLVLSLNPDAGGAPDGFAFTILDHNGNPIVTTDPIQGTLLIIGIDGSGATVQTYSSVSPAGVLVAVPESSTVMGAIAALGVAGTAVFRARKAARVIQN